MSDDSPAFGLLRLKDQITSMNGVSMEARQQLRHHFLVI